MKILHTSDWHLGMSLHNVSLIEDQRYFVGNPLEITKDLLGKFPIWQTLKKTLMRELKL